MGLRLVGATFASNFPAHSGGELVASARRQKRGSFTPAMIDQGAICDKVLQAAMISRPEVQDYKWLVESRSKIQYFLLELYTFLRANRSTLEQRQVERSVFGLFVGSGFSLWRAVFLAGPARGWSDVLKHAERFLEIVVRDNAINYPQDRETREWTVGYYLNNARFRVVQMETKLVQLVGSATVEELAALRVFLDLHHGRFEEADPKLAWNTIYDALNAAFVLLKREWLVNQKPN